MSTATKRTRLELYAKNFRDDLNVNNSILSYQFMQLEHVV